MSVLLETSKGDIVIDLYTDDCPLACTNFLKLCKIKYYNNCLFHTVIRNFLVQTGDPTGTGKGGESINGILYGDQARFFADEIRPHLRHKRKGLVSMAGGGKDMNASQFFITTGEELDSLDDKHTIFGEVNEGFEELQAINTAFVDDSNRPLQNVRVRHTLVLEDPFPDPPQLADHIPEQSPEPEFATEGGRLEDDWVPQEDGRAPEIIEAEAREYEAQKKAEVLEMVGDLPSADAKPPPNMIFVCKLNPVTTEEDLEIIFARFGKVTSCDIIRDYKTGDSLCYAFIGFDTDGAAESAYFKMENCLIDDRRIHVDFSQSMHHLWRQFRAFGKAGSANLKEEADNMRPQKRARQSDAMELKPVRGLYAGPVNAQRGGHGMIYGDDEEHTEARPRKDRHEEEHKRRSAQQHYPQSQRERDRSKDRARHRSDRDSDRHREAYRDRDKDRRRHSRDQEYFDHRNGETQPRTSRMARETPGPRHVEERYRSKEKKQERASGSPDQTHLKKEKKPKKEKHKKHHRDT